MKSVVPLLMLVLAGCERRVAEREPAALLAEGPVNPRPGVTTYRCVDGQVIVAGYPDPSTAVVTYKDHAYTLTKQVSASGARYTGYGLQWWVKGAAATISALKPDESIASDRGLACSAETGGPGSHGAAQPSTAVKP
jgi:membrane-bound inhibitor of C-type lysozyme